MNALTRTTR